MERIAGNIVDVLNGNIYSGEIEIVNGKIHDIKERSRDFKTFILPGFIDSHVHIESSMLTPVEFGRIASIHGTIAAIADPHEIANVLGIKGIKYMVENASYSPIKIYFGAPPCVPATKFDRSGATIGLKEIEELLSWNEIKFMAEVMDFHAVINGNDAIMEKIKVAKKFGKVIDGHAPNLTGKELKKYIEAGISTDHESVSIEEAKEKIKFGMKIQIREGSAAKNFDELFPLLHEHYMNCMLCTDDLHPDDLIKGHINKMVKRAVEYGVDVMKVLMAACVNPVKHYGLNVGLLQKEDAADFIVVSDLKNFNVLQTYVNGKKVAERGKPLWGYFPSSIINNFVAKERNKEEFRVVAKNRNINIIEIVPNQIITNKLIALPKIKNGEITSDIDKDIIKVAVVSRYEEKGKISIGFAKNLGIKFGAVASSISHDSHNIIGAGVTDDELCRAINLVIENKGGISIVNGSKEYIFPLPVAGLMSDKSYEEVAEKFAKLTKVAHRLGNKNPFMALSFLTLLPIPKIRISDSGLFDVEQQKFISLFSDSRIST